MTNMTVQQQEQFLNEWQHGANHDFAQVQELIALRQQRQAATASATATVTTQQQQLDPFTVKWNAWFAGSFDNHMKRHIEALNEEFRHIHKSMRIFAEAMGAKKDKESKKWAV